MSNANNQQESVSLWKMRTIETIEEFYTRKFGGVPADIRKEIGHFNVFKLDPFVGDNAKPVPYARRDYFKIMLVIGNYNMHYADGVAEIQKQALVFTNPQIPYSCEYTDRIVSGFFCLFTSEFFHQFGNLDQYAVFQPGGTHVFELNDEQVSRITAIYKSMFEEIGSDYLHKYDVLRNLFFGLLHFAMKLPCAKFEKQPMNASQRISNLFLELLERQFPIDENHKVLNLRSASDYASQLNVHVNHLNRAVKDSTYKTTSQIIAERIVRESKILLKHSAWNVSEISYALGFTETTHFNNFFKKHTTLSPLKFRNV
ncbi:MAG TPA: helix-turn-helix transcriptional regulator [Panacibacter sp.]|nr:helix-turn-helix transcriptional regulator [Panacibacter sp.]